MKAVSPIDALVQLRLRMEAVARVECRKDLAPAILRTELTNTQCSVARQASPDNVFFAAIFLAARLP